MVEGILGLALKMVVADIWRAIGPAHTWSTCLGVICGPMEGFVEFQRGRCSGE